MNKVDNPIVRWLYMCEGDMLEYIDRNNIVKQIGPILEIAFRHDRDKHYAPSKKYVLVPAIRDTNKNISVPLERVQAVIRNGVEMIRFSENEQQSTGCARCGQRKVDHTIPGGVFCSLHCQAEWIECYYGDYPLGQNPIDKGTHINTANCSACRKLNRIYCPNCVD